MSFFLKYQYLLASFWFNCSYLFIICLDYVLRTSLDLMKENGFQLAKERSRRYPAQTITDAD